MASKVEIDESGNMGSQDRYFIMSAIVVRRFDNLRPAIKELEELKRRQSQKKNILEIKYSHAHHDERLRVLESLNACDVDIVYVVIDKKGPGLYSNLRGKQLYLNAVKELLPLVQKVLRTKDVDLEFDETLAVRADELLSLSRELMPRCNVQSAKKVRSFANRGVQLADFVSGAIRDKYEHGEDAYFDEVYEKISLAHET
jgi:hypothetical protein